MSNFHVAIFAEDCEKVSGEHLDTQSFDEISECTAFANNADYGDIFEIHKDKPSQDFLRGSKKPNGHIDWVRTPY